MTSGKIKAVVFDVDGTLVNTPELIIAAYGHVARTHGLKPPTSEQILAQMGQSLEQIMQALFVVDDVAALISTNNDFIQAHLHEAELYADLLVVLEALRKDGVKLAAISGGNHKVVDVLRYHSIDHYFSSVVHSERITEQKPHPEGLLLALKECGDIPASQTVMVGDMRYDILTGKNANVHVTVGLTHGFGAREELMQAGADHIIDSFSQLPEVLGKLHAKR